MKKKTRVDYHLLWQNNQALAHTLLALPINFKNACLMFVLRDVLSVKKIIRVGHCKITMSAKWKSLFIALIRKTSFSYFKKNSSLFHGQFLLSLYM